MLKIAILHANSMIKLTQWGHPSDTCKKIFITSRGSFIKNINKADCVLVIHRFDINLLKSIKKPIIFFYGDYRSPILSETYNFMSMSKVVLLTWYRKDIYSKYNVFTVRQGVNPNVWCPIEGYEEKYDIVFSGSNYNSNIRMDIIDNLHRDFKLFVVGNGWPSYINSTSKKSPAGTNKFLNSGKVNVGIFNRQDNSDVKFLTSNRLYQGMACGKPHIGPRTIGLPTYFREIDYYMDYSDYSDLKTKINILLKNYRLRKRAGEAQRAAIIREHTVWHAWKRMETIIEANI